MNRKRELSSLYNLLFSKDKEIDFLTRKEEFLKNINLYKKFRKKLFQNIMIKSNKLSKDFKKYIFLFWKSKSITNSEMSVKRNYDYSFQKFIFNIIGQKVDKKLYFNNEINFSLSQIIRKFIMFLNFSKFILSSLLMSVAKFFLIIIKPSNFQLCIFML